MSSPEYYLDDAKAGAGRCESSGMKRKWDPERGAFTNDQQHDRASGLPLWEGEFSILGSQMRVSWPAETLEVAPGEVVTFQGLRVRESKGRLYFSCDALKVKQ